jgi:hypothetical protein
MELSDKEKLIEFISFCIENYKINHMVSGKKAAQIFSESELIDFLEESYELLHSQSKKYILEEIEVYLSRRIGKK